MRWVKIKTVSFRCWRDGSDPFDDDFDQNNRQWQVSNRILQQKKIDL